MQYIFISITYIFLVVVSFICIFIGEKSLCIQFYAFTLKKKVMFSVLYAASWCRVKNGPLPDSYAPLSSPTSSILTNWGYKRSVSWSSPPTGPSQTIASSQRCRQSTLSPSVEGALGSASHSASSSDSSSSGFISTSAAAFLERYQHPGENPKTSHNSLSSSTSSSSLYTSSPLSAVFCSSSSSLYSSTSPLYASSSPLSPNRAGSLSSLENGTTSARQRRWGSWSSPGSRNHLSKF